MFTSGASRATSAYALAVDGDGLLIVERTGAEEDAATADAPAAQGAAIATDSSEGPAPGASEGKAPVASALDAGLSLPAPNTSMVTPVGRIRLYCAHLELRSLFMFEFIDDVVDFTRSSADFDSIIRSVRFLT
jgi:hypothetical protein